MTHPVEVRFGLEVSSAWNLLDNDGRSSRDCYERVLRQTRLAQQTGWDAIFSGQYYVRHPVPILQPWPLLANLASHTTGMDLGTGIVLLPLLHPIDVAEEAATVDVVSGGRFILGVGAAYGEELDHFGIDRKSRGRRVGEMIEIIRALWRGEEFDYRGEFFELNGIQPTLLPVQRPGPEIWLAANADAAVKRAARVADTCFFNPHASLTTLQRQQNLFLDYYNEAGRGERPRWLPLMREVMVAETAAEARRLMRPYVEGQYQDVYVTHGQDKVMPADDGRFDLPFDDLARERFIIGDPELAAEQIASYVQAGFNYLVLQVPFSGVEDAVLESAIELLGTEVFPRVRRLVGAPPRD